MVLELALMGRLRIHLGGEALSRLVPGKAMALLCYLAVTGRPHPRQTLANLLWDNMEEAGARRNLRGVLMKLRRELAPFLIISNETLAFNQHSDYWLDVHQFRQHLARSPGDAISPDALQQGIALYRGEFLEEFYVRQAPGFDEWVAAQRASLLESTVEACLSLGTHYGRSGDHVLGIPYARKLLDLDPINEAGWRLLMRLLALNGQRSAALAAYGQCRDQLRHDLGLEPSAETIDVAEEIREGRIDRVGMRGSWPPLASVTEPGPRRPGSAVTHGDAPPFLAGPPLIEPRHFFGREREVKRLFNMLQRLPLQNAAIIGPRRSGKTSLLHYLKSITVSDPRQLRPGQRGNWLNQPERYRWIYVDFQDPRLGAREPLMRFLLTQMELTVPEPCNLERFLDAMADGIDRPTVILLDEVSVALSRYAELDDAFWESLRSVATNQVGGQLGFIMASAAAPDMLARHSGLGSPFFNIFGYTAELGPLSESAARALVASSPLPFPLPDIEWILEASGRWPILLQILCRERLLSLEEGEPGHEWKEEGLRQMAPFARSLSRDAR